MLCEIFISVLCTFWGRCIVFRHDAGVYDLRLMGMVVVVWGNDIETSPMPFPRTIDIPTTRNMSDKSKSYQKARDALGQLGPVVRRAICDRLDLQYDPTADVMGVTFVQELENHGDTMLDTDNVAATIECIRHVQLTARAVRALEEHAACDAAFHQETIGGVGYLCEERPTNRKRRIETGPWGEYDETVRNALNHMNSNTKGQIMMNLEERSFDRISLRDHMDRSFLDILASHGYDQVSNREAFITSLRGVQTTGKAVRAVENFVPSQPVLEDGPPSYDESQRAYS